MKKNWSKYWKGSKRPNKQRKYRFHAPLHIQHTFLGVHLRQDLRKKYHFRSFPLRKGDKVTVLRGAFKKRIGKVNKVSTKSQKVFIEGIEVTRKDGNKAFVAFQPSNLMIIEFDLTDKKRKTRLEKKLKETT